MNIPVLQLTFRERWKEPIEEIGGKFVYFVVGRNEGGEIVRLSGMIMDEGNYITANATPTGVNMPELGTIEEMKAGIIDELKSKLNALH